MIYLKEIYQKQINKYNLSISNFLIRFNKLNYTTFVFMDVNFCDYSVNLNQPQTKTIHLFDGNTFADWEDDTVQTWRIENGALVGGSLTEGVPHILMTVNPEIMI
ncbi:hypothetical protein BH23BAC1_BH23BAC1_22120 [soil metagenome]